MNRRHFLALTASLAGAFVFSSGCARDRYHGNRHSRRYSDHRPPDRRERPPYHRERKREYQPND